LRAISEGLGAAVVWDDAYKTVYITSPAPSPVWPIAVPTIQPVPRTTPPPEVFEQNAWFEVISPKRAQTMYDSNEQFILAYFSSLDNAATQYMPQLKQAAKDYGLKVYGVDGSNDVIGSSDLSFIWNYSRMYSIIYPLVFYVNGKADVEYMFGMGERQYLESMFDTFAYKSKRPPATPVPGSGPWQVPLATPRPTPTPVPDYSAYWLEVTRSAIDQKYNNNEKFILVYYHSQDVDSNRLIDTIKQASTQARIPVYACNAFGLSESQYWWGLDSISDRNFVYYPTVFLVNRRSVTAIEQPNNLDNLVALFTNFGL